MMEFAFVLLVMGLAVFTSSLALRNLTDPQRMWGCLIAAGIFFTSCGAFILAS